MSERTVVIDTNIVLDLWVYDDPRYHVLLQAWPTNWRWIWTASMREELRRVLDYPHIAARREQRSRSVIEVLGWADEKIESVPEALRAPFVCKDPDDQKYIDLAAAHQAVLLSKDKAILSMKRRMERLNVDIRSLP